MKLKHTWPAPGLYLWSCKLVLGAIGKLRLFMSGELSTNSSSLIFLLLKLPSGLFLHFIDWKNLDAFRRRNIGIDIAYTC